MKVPGIEPGDYLSRLYVPLRDRSREEGVETLGEVQRNFLAVYRFLTTDPIGDLNGFLTSYPENANDLPAAFAAIDAAESADIFRRCLDLFPDGQFPEDEEEAWGLRNDLAESSPESWLELEEYIGQHHDELVGKLNAYASTNSDALTLPSSS